MTAHSTYSGVAAEKLAELEERAVAGKPVEPQEYSIAAAAAKLEALAAQGEAGRAEEAARVAEAERRKVGVEAVKAGLVPLVDGIVAQLESDTADALDRAPDLALVASRIVFPCKDAAYAASRLIAELDTATERDRANEVRAYLELVREVAASQWLDHLNLPALVAQIDQVGQLLAGL